MTRITEDLHFCTLYLPLLIYPMETLGSLISFHPVVFFCYPPPPPSRNGGERSICSAMKSASLDTDKGNPPTAVFFHSRDDISVDVSVVRKFTLAITFLT